MIGLRLKKISEFIREGVSIADVGTDHAYLPIYLIKNKKISKAVAADINDKPLQTAIDNISSNGLSDMIKTVKSDGLQEIDSESVDDIIIAGMGGELISEIIDKAAWVKNSRYNLILQPMTKAELLRKYLYENGFEIKREETVCEGDKVYTVILSSYSSRMPFFSLYNMFIGEIDTSNQGNMPYIKNVLKSLENKCKGLEHYNKLEEYNEYKMVIERISKEIGVINNG